MTTRPIDHNTKHTADNNGYDRKNNKNSLAVHPAVATARIQQLLEQSINYETIVKLPRDRICVQGEHCS